MGAQRQFKSSPGLSATVEWLIAALAAAACFALPIVILASQGESALWPLPGLVLLEIALLGLAGFAAIAGVFPQALRGPAAAWVACGSLGALGLIGWFGVSVVFFALVPSVLFGLAAGLATQRRGRGWRDGLTTLVLSAGVNTVVLFVLFSLRAR